MSKPGPSNRNDESDEYEQYYQDEDQYEEADDDLNQPGPSEQRHQQNIPAQQPHDSGQSDSQTTIEMDEFVKLRIENFQSERPEITVQEVLDNCTRELVRQGLISPDSFRAKEEEKIRKQREKKKKQDAATASQSLPDTRNDGNTSKNPENQSQMTPQKLPQKLPKWEKELKGFQNFLNEKDKMTPEEQRTTFWQMWSLLSWSNKKTFFPKEGSDENERPPTPTAPRTPNFQPSPISRSAEMYLSPISEVQSPSSSAMTSQQMVPSTSSLPTTDSIVSNDQECPVSTDFDFEAFDDYSDYPGETLPGNEGFLTPPDSIFDAPGPSSPSSTTGGDLQRQYDLEDAEIFGFLSTSDPETFSTNSVGVSTFSNISFDSNPSSPTGFEFYDEQDAYRYSPKDAANDWSSWVEGDLINRTSQNRRLSMDPETPSTSYDTGHETQEEFNLQGIWYPEYEVPEDDDYNNQRYQYELPPPINLDPFTPTTASLYFVPLQNNEDFQSPLERFNESQTPLPAIDSEPSKSSNTLIHSSQEHFGGSVDHQQECAQPASPNKNPLESQSENNAAEDKECNNQANLTQLPPKSVLATPTPSQYFKPAQRNKSLGSRLEVLKETQSPTPPASSEPSTLNRPAGVRFSIRTPQTDALPPSRASRDLGQTPPGARLENNTNMRVFIPKLPKAPIINIRNVPTPSRPPPPYIDQRLRRGAYSENQRFSRSSTNRGVFRVVAQTVSSRRVAQPILRLSQGNRIVVNGNYGYQVSDVGSNLPTRGRSNLVQRQVNQRFVGSNGTARGSNGSTFRSNGQNVVQQNRQRQEHESQNNRNNEALTDSVMGSTWAEQVMALPPTRLPSIGRAYQNGTEPNSRVPYIPVGQRNRRLLPEQITPEEDKYYEMYKAWKNRTFSTQRPSPAPSREKRSSPAPSTGQRSSPAISTGQRSTERKTEKRKSGNLKTPGTPVDPSSISILDHPEEASREKPKKSRSSLPSELSTVPTTSPAVPPNDAPKGKDDSGDDSDETEPTNSSNQRRN